MRKAVCNKCGHTYDIKEAWLNVDDPRSVDDVLRAVSLRRGPTLDGYCTQLADKFECDGRVKFEDNAEDVFPTD